MREWFEQLLPALRNLLTRTSPPDSRRVEIQGQACVQALPIWSAQLENVRTQTEEAVVMLSTRFSGIVDRLDTALGVENDDLKKDSIRREAEEGAEQLSNVVQALREIQRSRDEIANDIRALVQYTEELEKMSTDVEDIAFQTNMLALNAAIEAAHAGDRGKGFAVVAGQVRELSDQARDTGKRINEKVKLITAALLETGLRNDRVSAQDKKAVESSEELINRVLLRFEQRSEHLAEIANQANQESAAIRTEVGESLVQLQFQDRTGQILAELSRNMDHMMAMEPEDSAETETQVKEEARLHVEKMVERYTTAEQHAIHSGLAVEAVAPQKVEFF